MRTEDTEGRGWSLDDVRKATKPLQSTEATNDDPKAWMREFTERFRRETSVTCPECRHNFPNPVFER